MTEKIDIKEFRKLRGWSQSDLARELGINQSTVHRWEAYPEKMSAISRTAITALKNATQPEALNNGNS